MSEEILGRIDLHEAEQVETDPNNVVQVLIPWDDAGDPEGGSPGYYDFWEPIMNATYQSIRDLINAGKTVQLVDGDGNIRRTIKSEQP